MSSLVEKREYIQRTYTKYSNIIDKVVRFVIAFLMFTYINANIGFSEMVANVLVVLALSVACAFLPSTATIIMAVCVTLIQMYTLAPILAVVTAIIFLVMFIFCFRFVPKQAIILLLVPIAFMLKVPMLIPIACGLLGTPIYIVAVIFGTIFYYMIYCVKSYNIIWESATETGVTSQMTAYTQQLFGNREMWFMILAFVVALIVVYSIRRSSKDNAWRIASITGAVITMIILLLASIDVNFGMSPIVVIIGCVLSAFLAMVIEFFAFPVDYSRTEYLQFEDDEYYYYVKAVPKTTVAAPKKIVKKIHERQRTKPVQPKEEITLESQFTDEIDLQKLLEEELKL